MAETPVVSPPTDPLDSLTTDLPGDASAWLRALLARSPRASGTVPHGTAARPRRKRSRVGSNGTASAN